MRWHFVTDRTWKPAHTPWDDPAEIDLAWREDVLPTVIVEAPDDRMWSSPVDPTPVVEPADHRSSTIHQWLRQAMQRLFQRRTWTILELDVDGQLLERSRLP